MKLTEMQIVNVENTKDPIEPDIVFLGLNFVNLGPLKIFPNTYPPMSEATQVNKIINIKIFKFKIDDKITKNIQ